MLGKTRFRGWSLVDVLIAVALFAVAFLALLALYPVGQRAVAQARALNAGIFLAEQILESERARGFDQIVSVGPLPVESDRLQHVQAHGQLRADSFRYQTLVTPIQDGLSPAAKNLVVLVSWNVGDNLRTVSLETEVAKL